MSSLASIQTSTGVGQEVVNEKMTETLALIRKKVEWLGDLENSFNKVTRTDEGEGLEENFWSVAEKIEEELSALERIWRQSQDNLEIKNGEWIALNREVDEDRATAEQGAQIARERQEQAHALESEMRPLKDSLEESQEKLKGLEEKLAKIEQKYNKRYKKEEQRDINWYLTCNYKAVIGGVHVKDEAKIREAYAQNKEIFWKKELRRSSIGDTTIQNKKVKLVEDKVKLETEIAQLKQQIEEAEEKLALKEVECLTIRETLNLQEEGERIDPVKEVEIQEREGARIACRAQIQFYEKEMEQTTERIDQICQVFERFQTHANAFRGKVFETQLELKNLLCSEWGRQKV